MEPVLARGMEKGPRLFLSGHPDRARVCIRVDRRGWQLLTDAQPCAASPEAIPKARASAIKALELDETLAEAHASLGVIKAYGRAKGREGVQESHRTKPKLLASP
jgi:hypothetical protein